jgi:HNH endonuclease
MRARDMDQGLTHAELRRRFVYSPVTGVFTYLIAPSNLMLELVGTPAGYLRNGKYLVISIEGFAYYAHRLAWFYVHGVWPKEVIDHINGVKTDNRIANLRPATEQLNQFNVGVRKDSKTGYKGVTHFNGKFKAQICVNRKIHYLGLFKTAEEAHVAYSGAARQAQGGYAKPPVPVATPNGVTSSKSGRNPLSEAVRANNSSGMRGVSPHKDKYRAQIYVGGKARHLGVFATKEEAYAAYCKAAEENSRPNENGAP